VIEAGEQSGALITARFAADQGREVFAVPGSIFAHNSAGVNRLIRDGATPATSVNDILEALNLQSIETNVEAQMLFPADETEASLLDQLADDPVHVDVICRSIGLPVATVSSTLALMELKGLVHSTGGMCYVRAREAGPVYHLD
jgi:DNA processing protein